MRGVGMLFVDGAYVAAWYLIMKKNQHFRVRFGEGGGGSLKSVLCTLS